MITNTSFFEELKRRNVTRMAVLYGVTAWLLLQVTDVLASLLPVPDWTGSLVVVLLIIGFPITLIISWVYELTPEGLKRERDVIRDQSLTPQTGRKIDVLIVALLVLAILIVAVDRLVPEASKRAETQATNVTIEAADVAQIDFPATDLPPIRSVVIFPFRCRVERDYLCFGFSEALTSTLYHLEELRVVKSREAFATEKSTKEVAREFEVDSVIEGLVRYDATRFTVVADLIDGRNESVLFSNTYEGSEENVFDLQERVATDVRRSITGKESAAVVAASRPASFAAFDKYSEGQYEFEKRSEESIRNAISLFRETLELDPNFGPAYMMLAHAFALLPDYSEEPRDLAYERALLIAGQGAAADPSISDAIATINAFVSHKRGDWIGAELGYRRALAAEPIYPVTHQLYSRLLASVGRLDASLEQAEKARRLDPQSAVLISRLAMANFWVGRNEKARRLFAKASGMDLEAPIHDLAYALFALDEDEVNTARQFAKAGLAKYGEDYSWVDSLFDMFGDPARHEQAHQVVEALSATGQLAPRVEITLWALLGSADDAMRVARRLEDEGEVFEAELLFIPQFREVREHPEFTHLMQAIGLTAYWDSIGCRWQNDSVDCTAPETD